jgi:hypothetical protein
MFFAVLGASAIALALADAVPLFRLHHALFPGLRGPGRVLFVATVSLAILGAIGLQRFIEVASARQRVPVMRGAAVTAIVIATAALALVPYVSGSGPAPSHLWPWLPLIAACGFLCAGWLAARKGPRAALVVALCFVAVDVSAFAFGSVETYPVETVQELRKWLGPPDTGRAVSFCEHRVNAGGMLLNTQASVDGMAGVHLGDYADWAYVAKFGDPVPHDGIVRRIGSEGQLAARRDLLDVANVTTFLACEPLEAPALKLVSYSDGLYRYRNLSAWPRAVWTCDAEEMSRAEAVRTILDGRYDEHGRLVRRRYINVRWWPWVPPERRRDVELRHGLLEGVAQHGMTWRYVYDNPSAPNGLALIRDPAVEDTEGLDRATGALVDRPSRATADVAGPTELLVGTKDCASRANVKMLVHDQPDGRVSLRVDAPVPGIVFLSEPYYPERQAFVDGKPVTPVKANLAFTAVPVLPGPHRVELRHVPSSFHLGLGISAFTLVAWAGLLVRR